MPQMSLQRMGDVFNVMLSIVIFQISLEIFGVSVIWIGGESQVLELEKVLISLFSPLFYPKGKGFGEEFFLTNRKTSD